MSSSLRRRDRHDELLPFAQGCGWVASVAAIVAVALHLSRVGWGLDRTDEGQYLLLLTNPEDSRATVFLFGYVLHPLFAALGGDVVMMRVVGALVSVGMAGVLGYTAARVSGMARKSTLITSVVAAGFGVGPFLYFPPTPSYNTLAFWGVCLWATGLLVMAQARGDVVGAVLVGVGGVTALAGKVTTGAALGVMTVVVVGVLVAVLPRDRLVRGVRWAGGVGLGAVAALAVLMGLVGRGPVGLVEFYREGARQVALLQGHEHLLRLDPFRLGGVVAVPVLLVVGAVAAGRVGSSGRRGWQIVSVVLGAAGVGWAGVVSLRGSGPADSPIALLALWWIPVLAAPLILAAPREARERSARATTWVLVAVLMLVPLAYVVGTNGDYWIAQSRAAVFWVVAAVMATARLPVERRLIATGSGVLLLVVCVSSLAYGYRYAPARHVVEELADVSWAVVSPEGAALDLTVSDANESRRLARIAQTNHLAGVPMLDVTGASPGYIWQLGGRPVGSSWLLGGYPGSEEAAVAAVRGDDPRRVNRAWVLDAPDSPRRIPGLLPALGRSVDRDYEVVATFRHTLGYNVRLLRPRAVTR